MHWPPPVRRYKPSPRELVTNVTVVTGVPSHFETWTLAQLLCGELRVEASGRLGDLALVGHVAKGLSDSRLRKGEHLSGLG